MHKGISSLLFSRTFLNNENDFPEILLLDVWRLCSLQRKIRVDAAAMRAMVRLKRVLGDLHDTDIGRIVSERVAKTFLSVDYGVRGIEDNSPVLELTNGINVMDQLREELVAVLPEQAGSIMDNLQLSVDANDSRIWQPMLVLSSMVECAIKTDTTFSDEPWAVLTSIECDAIRQRLKKNIVVLRQIYRTAIAVHLEARLRGFIEDEVAKLP
jgi:hypothetical protein